MTGSTASGKVDLTKKKYEFYCTIPGHEAGRDEGHDHRLVIDGIDPGRIPRHIAIVMDGNGRWAQQRGLKRTEGHAAGEEALFDTVEGGLELGLPWMTVYAFSTENWRRPIDEVRFLMRFNESLLLRRRDDLNERGVRVRFIGRRGGRVPEAGAAPHRGHRGAHREEPPDDAHVRVQLRRPRPSSPTRCRRSRRRSRPGR